MRRKATTVLASLLILWGLSTAFVSSGVDTGWTFYTPYSSMYVSSGTILEADTAARLVQRLPSGFGWTLLLIGSMLVTLMQAPRRIAVWAMVAYGLAILTRFATIVVIGLEAPRRYHYYYFEPGKRLGTNLLTVISLLLLAIGFLVSVVPPLAQRFSKPSGGP